MRVSYTPPQPHHFDVVFDLHPSQFGRGGGLNDIRIYQKRGGSLFGILGGMFKRAIPFLKSIILPEIGNLVKNITHDISHNIPARQSFKNNVVTSVKNVGSRIVRGGRRNSKSKKKVKSVKKKIVKKKRKKKIIRKNCGMKGKDIFTSGLYDV